MSVIKNIREEKGFTQIDLAKKTGLSLRTIQRLEASNKKPKGHTLKMISDIFDMEPDKFQEHFQNLKRSKASEKTSLMLINLSILSFIVIPFGNIIVPIVLWRKNRNAKVVDDIGRRIINFQILWSITSSILLCISPFIGRIFFSNMPLILIVLFVVYAINIVVVCGTAMKLQRNNYNVLDVPLRFL